MRGNNDNVPQPQDYSDYSVESVVKAITSQINVVRDDGDTDKRSFYVGICKNIKDNMLRHGNDSYVALVDCETRENQVLSKKDLER